MIRWQVSPHVKCAILFKTDEKLEREFLLVTGEPGKPDTSHGQALLDQFQKYLEEGNPKGGGFDVKVGAYGEHRCRLVINFEHVAAVERIP